MASSASHCRSATWSRFREGEDQLLTQSFVAKEVQRHSLALAVELDRRPEGHGGLPIRAAGAPGRIGWLEKAALNVAADPVDDAVTEVAKLGKCRAYFLKEGGMVRWR